MYRNINNTMKCITNDNKNKIGQILNTEQNNVQNYHASDNPNLRDKYTRKIQTETTNEKRNAEAMQNYGDQGARQGGRRATIQRTTAEAMEIKGPARPATIQRTGQKQRQWRSRRPPGGGEATRDNTEDKSRGYGDQGAQGRPATIHRAEAEAMEIKGPARGDDARQYRRQKWRLWRSRGPARGAGPRQYRRAEAEEGWQRRLTEEEAHAGGGWRIK